MGGVKAARWEAGVDGGIDTMGGVREQCVGWMGQLHVAWGYLVARVAAFIGMGQVGVVDACALVLGESPYYYSSTSGTCDSQKQQHHQHSCGQCGFFQTSGFML